MKNITMISAFVLCTSSSLALGSDFQIETADSTHAATSANRVVHQVISANPDLGESELSASLDIYQAGSDNLALVSQYSSDFASIQQTGAGNHVSVQQSLSGNNGNIAHVHQSGIGFEASVTQSGSSNFARISQF